MEETMQFPRIAEVVKGTSASVTLDRAGRRNALNGLSPGEPNAALEPGRLRCTILPDAGPRRRGLKRSH
jgi:hypothetical protein